MNVETILTASITIIAAIGGTTAYFWKARGDYLIKLQAEEITALTGKANRFEKDNAALLSENKILKKHNEKLSEMAQGSPQLKTLTIAIETLSRTINAKIMQPVKD
jgi:hypothetical protein